MFHIGQSYRNRAGTYEVTNIVDGFLYIKYENGATAKVPIDGQEEIVEDIENEKVQGGDVNISDLSSTSVKPDPSVIFEYWNESDWIQAKTVDQKNAVISIDIKNNSRDAEIKLSNVGINPASPVPADRFSSLNEVFTEGMTVRIVGDNSKDILFEGKLSTIEQSTSFMTGSFLRLSAQAKPAELADDPTVGTDDEQEINQTDGELSPSLRMKAAIEQLEQMTSFHENRINAAQSEEDRLRRENTVHSESVESDRRPSLFRPLVPDSGDEDSENFKEEDHLSPPFSRDTDTRVSQDTADSDEQDVDSPVPPSRSRPSGPRTGRPLGPFRKSSEEKTMEQSDEPETADSALIIAEPVATAPGFDYDPDARTLQIPRYFVFGLGGTGVKIVDQAKRSDHYKKLGIGSSMLNPRAYDYLLADTSEEVDADSDSERSLTYEGVDSGWLRRDRLHSLADLTHGASRVPPIGEFIADKTMEEILNKKRVELSHAQTTFLIHSGAGGTGSGLAPWVATWLKTKGYGGKLVSLLTLNKINDDRENLLEIENAIYNFPRVNATTDLVIVIDNRHISAPLTTVGSQNRDMLRYSRYIEVNEWKGQRPSYMASSSNGYILSDRYAYRVMAMLTRLPEDLGNNLAFFQADPRYSQGGKWIVPYLYPMDMDYETDYHGFPPAAFALKALVNGGLAKVTEGGTRGRMVLVVMELPEQYTGRTVVRDVQKVISEVLLTEEENVRVLISKSPVDGIAVGIFLLSPPTNFLLNWYKEASTDRKYALHSDWQRRVNTGPLSDGIGNGLHALEGPWAGVSLAIAQAKNKSLEMDQSIIDAMVVKYEAEARQAGEKAASIDICAAFINFANKFALFS